MKKIYSKISLIVTFLSVIGLSLHSQNCIQTSLFPSSTINIAQTGTTNVTTCNYGGEYSVNSFTAIGSYTVTSSVTGDYITVTDNSNNVLVSGAQPLTVSIPSVGIYRIHVSTNSSCGTQSSCRSINVARVVLPCLQTSLFPSSTTNIAGTGTTNITTCNYGGEYSVNSFSAAGSYTITSSIGTDYITLTDNSNTHIISGFTPLSVVIPSVGVYRVHVSTSSSCGTQSSCRSINLIGPPPPAVANDNCSGAILLSAPSSTAGTTIGATAESPSPGNCVTTLNQPGVWYRVVGNGNKLGADLCADSGWDSKIFVYSGTCGSLTCVAGNDDGGPICSSAAASVTWCSVPSTTYYILVTGYSFPNAFTVAITQTIATSPTLAASAASSSLCPSITTTLTASGATTYSWSTSSTSSSIAVSPSATTIYSVTGRDVTGCAATTQTVSVFTYPTPTITIATNTGVVCPGGAFTITPSGAATYTYASPTSTVNGSSTVVSPLVNTTYTVRGTSSNGCISTTATAGSVTLTTQPSPTLILASNPVSVCPGFSSTITVSGANTYTWTSPSSNATAVVVTPSATTIYTVSGTGTTVCDGVKTLTLTVLPTPVISVNNGTICSGYNFTMNPTGASTYTYADASGTVANVVSPVANANYTVSGTSALGCISNATTVAVSSVVVNTSPTVSAVSGTMCFAGGYSLMPSGATTYSLNGASTTTMGMVNPSVTTTYSVTGTGTNGCVSPVAALADVTVVPLPVVTAVAASTAICIGQATAVLTASGASTYTWSTLASGSNISVSPTATAVYSVVGTSSLLCNNIATVSVLVNPLPMVAVAPTSTFICVGSSATLTASGANSYLWSTGGSSNAVTVSPSVTTSYNVVGTSTAGCTSTVVTAINVNTITISTTPNSTICAGTGIALTASGATSYTWNSTFPFQTITVTPSVAAVYNVFAIDMNNCSHSKSVSVGIYQLPTVTAAPSKTLICIGESATVTANGATSYTWNGGIVGNSIVVSPTVNVMFTYSVTGVDANSCTAVGITTMVVSPCTGITESQYESVNISVYPNPNNGDFTIKNSGEATLNLINELGQLIRVISLNEQNDYAVNVTGLSYGIYFITDAKGGKLNQKVVIMH